VARFCRVWPRSTPPSPAPAQHFVSECLDFLVHVDLPAQEGRAIASKT